MIPIPKITIILESCDNYRPLVSEVWGHHSLLSGPAVLILGLGNFLDDGFRVYREGWMDCKASALQIHIPKPWRIW